MLKPVVAAVVIAIEQANHKWTAPGTGSFTGGEHSSMEGSKNDGLFSGYCIGNQPMGTLGSAIHSATTRWCCAGPGLPTRRGHYAGLFHDLCPCRAPDAGIAIERRLHQVNPCTEANL
jgi:hypothetical protein